MPPFRLSLLPRVMAGSLRQFALVGATVAVAGGVAYALWRNYYSCQGPAGREDQPSRLLGVQGRSAGPPAGQDKPSSKQILVLGLDGAGKTSILYSLATNQIKRNTVPTKGFNAVYVNTEETKMEFLEIGGSESLREYWKMYMPRVLLLIYVVDSADHERFPVAKKLLHQLVLNHSTLPVMILANKQDLEGAYCITDVHDALALSEIGDERLQELAKPKLTKNVWNFHRSLFLYSCGQMSEIWQRSSALYSVMPSKRLLKLAEPRAISAIYLKKRPRTSPMWPIRPSALTCVASQRLLTLAQARSIHPDFIFPEKSEREISRIVRRAEANPRIQQLSQPVVRKQMQFYENTYKEVPIRKIPLSALRIVPSPRLFELAKPKGFPSENAMDRSPEWPVSVAAMRAVASPRLSQLAQPPIRFELFIRMPAVHL